MNARLHVFVLFLLFSARATQAQAADQTSSINGVVLDESSKPVRGATVILRRTGGVKLAKLFLPPNVVTDAKGAFQASKVPSGTYTGCASLAGSIFLNPCEWSSTAPIVSVAIGEAKTGFSIVMKSGKQLSVRLDDAQHLLKSPVQGVPGETVHPVIVQISSPFGLHPPHTVTNDTDGQTHSWTVPVGVALKLDVWSSSASVKGEADAPSFNINEGKVDRVLPGNRRYRRSNLPHRIRHASTDSPFRRRGNDDETP